MVRRGGRRVRKLDRRRSWLPEANPRGDQRGAVASGAPAIFLQHGFYGEKFQSSRLDCAPEKGECFRVEGEMRRPLPSRNQATNVDGIHGFGSGIGCSGGGFSSDWRGEN
jgi:hypothetical protein